MGGCCSKVVLIELQDIVFSKFAWISGALNGGPVWAESPGKSGGSAGVKQQDLLHENKTSIRAAQIIYSGILLIHLLFLYVLLACSSLTEAGKHHFQQQHQHFYQLGARWKRSHIFFFNQTSWIWCTIKWVGVRGFLVWHWVPGTFSEHRWSALEHGTESPKAQSAGRWQHMHPTPLPEPPCSVVRVCVFVFVTLMFRW